MAIGKQKKNIKKNKGATRNRRSEKKSNNGQKKKKTKRQAITCKTLHRKLKIKQHEPHKYGCTRVLRKGKRILLH